jgi:hypothetical protein
MPESRTVKNRRKNLSQAPKTGEFPQADDMPRRQQRPWETRSFDAAMTSMTQFR